MPKIIILYTSLTGNTEEMAEAIAEGVQATGVEFVCKDAFNAKVDELLVYDAIIIGAYTWGDGELPDEFLDFYDDLNKVDLAGKKAAVFGSGDTSYPIYCGAVDIIEQKLREIGAEIVCESLKFEYNASDDEKGLGKRIGEQVAALLTVA